MTATAPDDLTGLRALDEARVLACLRERYAALQPYTYITETVLISVNPYQRLERALRTSTPTRAMRILASRRSRATRRYTMTGPKDTCSSPLPGPTRNLPGL